jgi:hypothetical protein
VRACLAETLEHTGGDSEIALSMQEYALRVLIRLRDLGSEVAAAALPPIIERVVQVDAAAPGL